MPSTVCPTVIEFRSSTANYFLMDYSSEIKLILWCDIVLDFQNSRCFKLIVVCRWWIIFKKHDSIQTLQHNCDSYIIRQWKSLPENFLLVNAGHINFRWEAAASRKDNTLVYPGPFFHRRHPPIFPPTIISRLSFLYHVGQLYT